MIGPVTNVIFAPAKCEGSSDTVVLSTYTGASYGHAGTLPEETKSETASNVPRPISMTATWSVKPA